MKARLWISVFAAAFFALTSCAAFAQANGHGKGNGKDKDKDKDDRVSERVEFRQHDRDSMNEWYREHQHALPPGLAKRDRLPPGLEKQLQERGTLPPGLQKRIQPVPEDLEVRLAPPPEGCRHVIIGGDVVLLNVRTNYVYSVVHFEIQ
jgi:Ni/Co efflux regulator RcnB